MKDLEEAFIKKTQSALHEELGGKVSLGTFSRTPQGHLLNQRDNRAMGPGWIQHVLAKG